MANIAIYKGSQFKVRWKGIAERGDFKGVERVKLVPLEGKGYTWANLADVTIVDNKAKEAGK